MKQFLFVIVLFLLIISEGIAIDFLPEAILASKRLITPHWVFIFLFIILMFYDHEESYYAIAYGIIFGLLTDIIYTDVLGVYTFVYPFVLYIISILKTYVNNNIIMLTILTIFGLILVEILLFVLYGAIGVGEMSITYFIQNRLLPTVLANVVFMFLLYFLSRKWIQRKEKSFL